MQKIGIGKVWASSVLNREIVTLRLNDFWAIDLSN